MKNRLQFRHNDTLFTNSEQAKAYIESQMKGASGKIALYGEPIVAKYGDDENNPNIIVAIGSVGDGNATGENNNYFIIDQTARDLNIAKNSTAIKSEELRAKTAESDLWLGITGEYQRAHKEEGILAAAIVDERNRATTVEGELRTDLTSETNARIDADNTISTNLTNEIARAISAESGLGTSIITEASRAMSAESALATGIYIETARATTAEYNLNTKIDTNASAIAIALNSTGLYNEITRAEEVESTLSSGITANANAIVAETNRATAAEGLIANNLTTEINRAKNEESILSSGITAEYVRAASAENNLAILISSGSSGLAAEIERATTAENLISTNLTTEITRAKENEAALSSGIAVNASGITAEYLRAASAENNLLNKINTNSSNIAINASGITAEYLRAASAENGLSTKISINATAIANEILRAEKAEADLSITFADTNTIDFTRTNLSTGTQIIGDVKLSRANGNQIIEKDNELGNGLFMNVGLITDITASASTRDIALLVNGATSGVISLPLAQFIKDATYDSTTKKLIITFVLEDQTTKEVEVDLSALVDTYEGGTAISVNGKLISVNVDPNSEYLTVTSSQSGNALLLSGINTAISTAVATETNRATAVEGLIANNLASEITRAKGIEAILTTGIAVNASGITAEYVRAASAENNILNLTNTNSTNLTTEINRAKGAESTLSSGITANANAIVTETNRATAAEGLIANNLATEITRAKGVEATLTTDIAVNATAIYLETNRATAAEGLIANNLTTEINRAKGVESTLSSGITANANAIITETNRATAAEGTLSTRITANANAITGLDTRVSTIENADYISTAASTSINGYGNNQYVAGVTAIGNHTLQAIFNTLPSISIIGTSDTSKYVYGFTSTGHSITPLVATLPTLSYTANTTSAEDTIITSLNISGYDITANTRSLPGVSVQTTGVGDVITSIGVTMDALDNHLIIPVMGAKIPTIPSITTASTGTGNAITSIVPNDHKLTMIYGNAFLPLSGGTLTGNVSVRNLTPVASGIYGLGNSTYPWLNIYTNNTYTLNLRPITGTVLTSYASIVPSATTTYDLGSASLYWNNGYIANLKANTIAATSISASSVTSSTISATTGTITTLNVTNLNVSGGGVTDEYVTGMTCGITTAGTATITIIKKGGGTVSVDVTAMINSMINTAVTNAINNIFTTDHFKTTNADEITVATNSTAQTVTYGLNATLTIDSGSF